MITKEYVLNSIRESLKEIKHKFKVKTIGLFGSFSRGEQNENSDIDLLVDFEPGADLFDLIELENYLVEKLGRKVDAVPAQALRKEFRESILNEVAYI